MTLEEAKEVKVKLDLAVRQIAFFTKQLEEDGYTVQIYLPSDILGGIQAFADAQIFVIKLSKLEL